MWCKFDSYSHLIITKSMKYWKVSLSICKGHKFSSKSLETMVWHIFSNVIFNLPLKSYLTHKNHLTTPLLHLLKSYSNYHQPLNAYNNIFIIILDCKNDIICLILSFTFSLFPLQVLQKLDLEVLVLGYFQNWLFWTGIWLGIPNKQ